MERSSDRGAQRAVRGVVLALLIGGSLSRASVASAQPLGDRPGIDSLQLSALSMDIGIVRPAMTEPATIFGLAADYGRLSRTLRLRFEVGYWESRLTDAVVKTFADSVSSVIDDPSGDDVVPYSRVTVYDVAMSMGVRWLPRQATVVQPFVGGGIGVHVINAEGPLISGTFVERLFDVISTGVFAETGVHLRPLARVGIEGRIRGDLLNGFRALSVRAGGVYYFGPLRRSDP